jgi:RNA polymerase sigma factor (TIGR02999 family)
MSDVTVILQSIQQGNLQAGDELLPLVYEELRRLAAQKMAKEDPNQTLQPTALVHEAWLRLAAPHATHWKDRSHFFSAAAEAMRRILIDQARRKLSLKRGCKPEAAEFCEAEIESRAPTEEALAVHDALDALGQEDPLSAEIVKLRYFAGFTIPEVAGALNISQRSAERNWEYARAWLRTKIQKNLGE